MLLLDNSVESHDKHMHTYFEPQGCLNSLVGMIIGSHTLDHIFRINLPSIRSISIDNCSNEMEVSPKSIELAEKEEMERLRSKEFVQTQIYLKKRRVNIYYVIM